MGKYSRNGVFRAAGLVAAVAVSLFAGAGCSYPKPIHTYEYICDYGRMSDEYEPLVSLVYTPQPLSFSRYKGIVIGPVQVGSEWVESREEARGYATFFRYALQSELWERGNFALITLNPDEDWRYLPLHGMLKFEGMITKFDMGSGLLRYVSHFLWLLEWGATDFQIEGRITEADTGKLLLEFVDRRRHLCNTPFGPNPRNFQKGFAMHVTAKDTAECLAKFVEMVYDGALVAQAGSGTAGRDATDR